jgi:hypothetical protein
MTTAELPRLCRSARTAIPSRPPEPIPWAEENVRLPGSARSERFDADITPWIKEPLSKINDALTRKITLIKPVQAGGSTFGEVSLLYWIAFCRGFLQYNWEDDNKAATRWESRIEPLLKACKVSARMMDQTERYKIKKCEVSFPTNLFFKMQGVWQPEALDSDSVRYQINEEIHNWKQGHLAKAFNRTSAFWFYWILNISNASDHSDQLHAAFETGTKQRWTVRCPGCGLYHAMRTKWDEKQPQLGGLRYDAEGCRRDDGSYDYNKLEPTIRFQMPCGYLVRESITERRQLSLSGKYSEPENKGSHISERSYILEAVSVDYIPWMRLIKEKHDALKILRYGDAEPYRRYTTERECLFWTPEDRPLAGQVVLSSVRLTTGERLGGKRFTPFALDRQQGSAANDERPHWWLVIRDVMPNGDSLLVFEGKLLSDEAVVAKLDEFKCVRHHGVADSGDDTTHVYGFCLKHGINAVKGGGGDDKFFRHEAEDGGTTRRIFSPEKPLHAMIGAAPNYPYVEAFLPDGKTVMVPDIREPLFWEYSRDGIFDRLAWLRKNPVVKWEVPASVSDAYKSHLESWELTEEQFGRSNETRSVWKQRRTRDDLWFCEAYIAMLMDQAGVIGQGVVEGEKKK